MIKIQIEMPKGDSFSTEVYSVPHIGDFVKVIGLRYRVTDVMHTLPDRYTTSSITVTLGA